MRSSHRRDSNRSWPKNSNKRNNPRDNGRPQRQFSRKYRCFSLSSINKAHLENGNKVIMPQSALHSLTSMHIDYPMTFEIHNCSAQRHSHCGVLEFTAEEGRIFLPNWMMKNLLLEEGGVVQMSSTSLPKGIFMKLQPHTKDFLDLSDPKAVLEKALRTFSCLTTGDTIMISHSSKDYCIDILETKPSSAITIIETDCEVGIASSLDYKESERAAPSTSYVSAPAQVVQQQQPQEQQQEEQQQQSFHFKPVVSTAFFSKDQQDSSKAETKFKAFTGVGTRLDGKPVQPSLASDSSEAREPKLVGANETSSTTSSSTSSSQPSGELVFGSNFKASNLKVTEKASATMLPHKDEKPSFEPFTGRKYILNG